MSERPRWRELRDPPQTVPAFDPRLPVRQTPATTSERREKTSDSSRNWRLRRALFARGSWKRKRVVEREVEREDVHSGLAKEGKLAGLHVMEREISHSRNVDCACGSHPSYLEQSVGGRYVWIEPRG